MQDMTGIQETVDENGTRIWRKNGVAHRDGDLPAVIEADGSKFWYQNGVAHRDGDKPSVVHPSGSMKWYWDSSRIHSKHDLLFFVDDEGSVVYKGSGRKEYTSEKIVSVKYEGIEYSVPHWLLEGHETSREESEG